MTIDPDKVGYLLKEGIVLVRAAYFARGIDKGMRAIEDELGVVIGREGHTIRKWKAGEIPQSSAFREDFLQSAELIAKGMIELGQPNVDWIWGERFLNAVGHPASTEIVASSLPYESPSRSTHRPNNLVQVEILIKFSVPRDLFFTRIRQWLGRLMTLTNGATHLAVNESEKQDKAAHT